MVKITEGFMDITVIMNHWSCNFH